MAAFLVFKCCSRVLLTTLSLSEMTSHKQSRCKTQETDWLCTLLVKHEWVFADSLSSDPIYVNGCTGAVELLMSTTRMKTNHKII